MNCIKKNPFDSISMARVNEMMYLLLLFYVLEVKSNTITDCLYMCILQTNRWTRKCIHRSRLKIFTGTFEKLSNIDNIS